MAEEKQNGKQTRQPEQSPDERPARRPYRRPNIVSRPLFERMALMCVDEFGDPIPGGPS